MDIRQLEAFLVVAKSLNFGESARLLNYSQSTISEKIHNLEAYLNARLFERIGRRVFLTEQGAKLIPFAERLIRDAEELKTLFKNEEALSGSIMVGAAETLCAFWLPPLLKEYRQLYPNVQISIKVGNCIDFPQWLQQNIVDVAFGLNDESCQHQLRQYTLFQGDTVFVVAPDHRLSVSVRVEPKELFGETLLLSEGYCGYPIDLRNLLAKEQVIAKTILEFGSLESIKQCVKNGLGVSMLPRIVVEEEVKRGELVILHWTGAPIMINAQMIFHRDKWISPPLSALERLIVSKITVK